MSLRRRRQRSNSAPLKALASSQQCRLFKTPNKKDDDDDDDDDDDVSKRRGVSLSLSLFKTLNIKTLNSCSDKKIQKKRDHLLCVITLKSAFVTKKKKKKKDLYTYRSFERTRDDDDDSDDAE